MPYRILKSSSLLRALVLCTAVTYSLAGSTAELSRQSSQAGGVSVSVEPSDVSATAAVWLFKVALNTHSVELSDDMTRIATLVDAAGTPHPAAAWDGDPPGGHHRKGTLKFKALSPRPAALELRILRPGEVVPRTFRWEVK